MNQKKAQNFIRTMVVFTCIFAGVAMLGLLASIIRSNPVPTPTAIIAFVSTEIGGVVLIIKMANWWWA